MRIKMFGLRFGRVIVLPIEPVSINRDLKYTVQCDCGKKKLTSGALLRRGKIKTCGCSQKAEKHGLTHHPLYRVWVCMRERCRNKNHRYYDSYGGRGISVCKRWDRFSLFLKDMGDRPSNKHSLDRINNNRGYKPSNCRWATQTEQRRNTRTSPLIFYKGKRRHLYEVADMLGINRETLRSRLDDGMPIKKALSQRNLKFASF